MLGGGTEVAVLGDAHDENVPIGMDDVTTSHHVSMPGTDEVLAGDMNTNTTIETTEQKIVSIQQDIETFETTLKKTTTDLQQTNVKANSTALEIELLEEEYDQKVRAQKRLQDKETKQMAELNETYERELQQQIDSTKQEVDDLENTWELVKDAMETIQINIEPCNDLLNYLKYISGALEQLKTIKALHEQEQPEEEQEQSINELSVTFSDTFLREEKPVNAQEVLSALENSVNALEKLLAIPEANSLSPVLESGKSMSAELVQIPALGMSVTEILTQAMPSTSNTSVTEILEAQIAALTQAVSIYQKIHSPLSYFIEKLRTIIDGKAAFTNLIESQIQKSELKLDDLTKKLTDFQERSIIPENTELSGELLKLEGDLINLEEQLKELNESKMRTEYDLDNLRLDRNKQHSTINSLTLDIFPK